MSEPLPTVHVAVAVIERDGRYLISRRRPEDHFGGFWEFPGGKRRPGESWPACLRRELREELGVMARVGRRLRRIRFRYPDRQVHLEVFRCAIESGTPRRLECQEVRWVRAAQLKRYRFPPADRELIQWLERVVSYYGEQKCLTHRRGVFRRRTPTQAVKHFCSG